MVFFRLINFTFDIIWLTLLHHWKDRHPWWNVSWWQHDFFVLISLVRNYLLDQHFLLVRNFLEKSRKIGGKIREILITQNWKKKDKKFVKLPFSSSDICASSGSDALVTGSGVSFWGIVILPFSRLALVAALAMLNNSLASIPFPEFGGFSAKTVLGVI